MSDSFPDGLLRVAQTLDALRDPPMPAELRGEVAARAAFRELMAPGASEGAPAWPAPETDGSRTLILAAGAPDGKPRSAPGRHRRHRRSQRGRWQVKALVAAAAVVVVVAGAALASTLSSSGGPATAAGSTAGAKGTATAATSPGSRSVQGSAKPEVTATPANTSAGESADGPSSSELCHEYFDYLANPRGQSGSTEQDVIGQLSARADGASVYYYCVRLLPPWAALRPGSSRGLGGYPIPGDFPGQQGQQGMGQQPGPGGNGNGNGQH